MLLDASSRFFTEATVPLFTHGLGRNHHERRKVAAHNLSARSDEAAIEVARELAVPPDGTKR